ncbi:UNVERIFIED_CONTAM: hypothetical protein H355_015036 [Colinus virginianus]|nr:hypothetical protein H355_015036 [Colinus virginianus]
MFAFSRSVGVPFVLGSFSSNFLGLDGAIKPLFVIQQLLKIKPKLSDAEWFCKASASSVQNVDVTAILLQFHFTVWDVMPKTLDGQITMEKTPSYFVTNEAPRRIHSMAKDTKLIVVVRNPVTRAISDYTQTLSKKPEIPTFEVLAFKNRTLGLIDASWSAIRIGIYALHLENWLQYFPLSQILFVSGERLITDPAGEMAKVQDFLGLKRIVTEKHFYFNKTKGFPCLKKPEDSSAPRCLGKSKGRTHPKIDPDVIHRLRKFYKPFNVMFYQMTGQDFEWEREESEK